MNLENIYVISTIAFSLIAIVLAIFDGLKNEQKYRD